MCSRSEVTAASEISHRRAGRTRGKRVKEKKKKLCRWQRWLPARTLKCPRFRRDSDAPGGPVQ